MHQLPLFLLSVRFSKKIGRYPEFCERWEMGLSTPTTQYIVALTKLFHVSADYILGTEADMSISLRGYSEEEVALVLNLLKYFDGQH